MPIDKSVNFPDVAHVQNGEPATEDTFSRPTINLENRTNELRQYVERVEARLAEDRNIDIDVEGLVGFNAGVLSWVNPIKIISQNRSYDMTIPAGSTTALSDGDTVYVDLPYEVLGSANLPDRGSYDGQIVHIQDSGFFKEWDESGAKWDPLTLGDLSHKVYAGLPSGSQHLDSLVIAVVKDSKVYFNNKKITLNANESKELDTPGAVAGNKLLAITMDGSQTLKDVDLTAYAINTQRSDFKLLDNVNYEEVDVKITRPSTTVVRLETGQPLSAGNYDLLILTCAPL